MVALLILINSVLIKGLMRYLLISLVHAGSPLGHEVNLTVNCHNQSLSPQVTYAVLDPDNTLPIITVRYTCNSTGDEVRGGTVR